MAGRIMIVEDDEDLRELFTEVLVDAGYDVHQAENGRVAEQLLEDVGAPGMVLLDLMMPVMGGAELLRRLRASERFARLPVVVLSAGGKSADVPDADAFVRKPVNPQQLLELVAQHCFTPPSP